MKPIINPSNSGRSTLTKHIQPVTTATIFVAISLRVITWFQHPNILMSGDLRIPLDINVYYRNFLHTWNEIDFGMPSLYLPRVLDPLYTLLTTFRLLGLELSVAEMMAIITVHLIALTIAYWYFKYLLNSWIATVVATIYVVTSPFLIVDREINAIMGMNLLIIVLTPTVFFIKGILSKNIVYSILAGMLFNLAYATSPNYRPAAFCLITILISCTYFFIKSRVSITITSKGISITLNLQNMRKYLNCVLVFLLTIIISSAWYFYIVYENYHVIKTSLGMIKVDDYLIDYYSNKINIFDSMRLLAKWSLFSGSLGRPYVPYRDFYFVDPIGIILTAIPPIIALITPLIFPRKVTIYFGFIAVLSIWLTSALYPLTELYVTLVRVSPLFMIVRESYWWSFFTVLCYGCLLGFFASSVYESSRRDFLKLIALVLLEAIFLSSTWPLVTGDVSTNWLNPRIRGSCTPIQHLIVNDRYLSQTYWTLFMPQRIAYLKYNFSGCIFESGNPYPLIYSKPIVIGIGIDYISSPSSKWVSQLYELIYRAPDNENAIPKLLATLGIKYVVYEGNIIDGVIRPLDPEKLTGIGLKIAYEGEDNLNDIVIYENPYAYQKIYVANKVVVISQEDVESLYKILNDYDPSVESIVFINRRIEGDLDLPKAFKWTQLSPTEYVIHAESEKPFILVLLQSFSSRWRIYINGKELKEDKHFIANVYANAWLIDEVGKLTIVIKYKTQETVTYMAMISVLIPILFIVLLHRRYISRFLRELYTHWASPSEKHLITS